VLNCFFLPARSALPPHLVPPAGLSAANALLVLGGIVATVLGSAVGGPLVDRFGAPAALYFDAATYLASVAALAFILRAGVEVWPHATLGAAAGSASGAPPIAGAENAAATAQRPGGVGALIRRAAVDVREGWRLALALPATRAPLIAAIATWVAGGVLHVAGVAHIQRGGVKVSGIGFLLASLAVGAVAGTAWTLRRERARPADAPATGVRRLALGIGLVGAGLGILGFAQASTLPLMALAGAVVGVFAAPLFFLSETALQEAVPAGSRGRLVAARDVLARGAFLLTAALAAPLVTARGTTFALASMGLLLVVLGLPGLVPGRRRPEPAAR
jgi:hypothetical protein